MRQVWESYAEEERYNLDMQMWLDSIHPTAESEEDMKKLPRNKSRHHRKARVAGGTNDKTNISIVTKKAHNAYHLLFQEGNPHQVANIINKTWLDPAFELVVQRKRQTLDW